MQKASTHTKKGNAIKKKKAVEPINGQFPNI